MFRLPQIIQNSFIRFEGFLYRILSFCRQFFGFLYQRFVALLQLLGFTNYGYFIESDEANSIKSAPDRQLAEAEPDRVESAPATTRRRPDSKMDYYLNIVRQTKNSS